MNVEMTSEQTLREAGIRATAVRIMVWREVRGFTHPFALSDLETTLPTVDRSTLFRTLVVLKEARLIHELDDGSGSQKYCVCHCDDSDHHHGHVHLSCRVCHRTYCLPNVEIPTVPVPNGFAVEEAEYVIKGVCQHCQLNRH